MKKTYPKLDNCFEYYQKKINFTPEIALVLGSGLGGLADRIHVVSTLDYSELESFPKSTVAGHKGRFVFGFINNVPVVIMQGRVHYYEGYSMQDVVLPIRLMKRMGAKVLFLTNAAGGVNFNFHPGDFMLIRDQISSFVPSPLLGENFGELGVRFPDMSEIYSRELCEIIGNTAKTLNLTIQEGIYLQLTGPNYETPAEVRMCRILGADAVGMSTACEAIAARHAGMKVCGISCISNLACGMSDQPLTHDEVQKMADSKAPMFEQLITASVVAIAEDVLGIK